MSRSRPNSQPRLSFRRGLSIIEASISLSISAMLLVAVAAAFNASASAVEMNDQFFRATQAARVSMNQILAAVRQGDFIDPTQFSSTSMSLNLPLNMVNSMAQPNETGRVYSYDATNQRVLLTIFLPGNVSNTYELASNVTAFAFIKPATNDVDYNLTQTVGHVSITMTVKAGNNTVTLSGAAMARRAIKY